MQCRICEGHVLVPLQVDSFLFPTISYAPEFHEYENYICSDCGVVSGQPEPAEDRLIEHYNTAYRQSRDAHEIDGTLIDAPIDMSITGRALGRVRNFHSAITRNKHKHPELTPSADEVIVDFGAYSGMFLHGISQLWDCRCIATDYNEKGVEFARAVFGFEDSFVTSDIYSDTFDEKVKFATMIHSLEHLREPLRFLAHLRENILKPDGYLYVEVPNLYGIALCDPTHFFTYSVDSMTYLMERGGFEVVDIFTSGFPQTPEFTGQNDIQNLICLARPLSSPAPAKRPAVDVDQIHRQLQASYFRHSVANLKRQFRLAARETAKFFYYLLFSVVLEKISPKLMARLARFLGLRGQGKTGS